MAVFTGYIASRPIAGTRVPQHIQNLVIREHCRQRGLTFNLSATEYAMPHCYLMLEKLVSDLPAFDGIVAYSMFMLPARAERRQQLYDRILAAGCSLRAACEDLEMASAEDARRWETILTVQEALNASGPAVPEGL